MIRGIYTSALGMITQMQRMDVVTNNMANVNTTGYKRDHVVSRAFSDEFITRLNDPGLRMFRNWTIGHINPGVFVDEVYTAFTQGPLEETGNPLDLGLMGEGFFVVSTGAEELYTRDGTFSLVNGMLLTQGGARVQGQSGDITLPHGYINIDEAGRIMVNDVYVDTLRLTTFSELTELRKMEDNFWRATEQATQAAFAGTVRQGTLEASNVNIVSEMMQMIVLSRAYETNARILSIQDQTLQGAVNEIARR